MGGPSSQERTQSSGIKPSRLLPTSREFAFPHSEKIHSGRIVEIAVDFDQFL